MSRAHIMSRLSATERDDERRRRRAIVLGAIGLPFVGRVRAQGGKTLRIIVPFPPGGSPDILARAIGARIGPALGQAVVVDNRPGAGGTVGAAEAARAEADGQTLLMGHVGTLAVAPTLYPKLPYDPLKAFVPVAAVARVPNVLVVNAASPLRSLADLVASARAQPGKLTYSSGGNGSAAHIAFALLEQTAKFSMLHIPYRGTAPSLTDLLGGQVDATFTGAPAVLPHVRSGRLRALAVSSTQRIPTLPDVPTVAESGYPGFDADQWYGIVAPAKTPPAAVARLNAEVNVALRTASVAQQFAAQGAIAIPQSPPAFGDLIAHEVPRWAQVVRAGNIKPE